MPAHDGIYDGAVVGVGVIGHGYWGPNLVRNVNQLRDARVMAVCDTNADRLRQVGIRHPSIHLFDDYERMLSEAGIHAVCIATPVSTHFELAMAALRAGKHVLVEKPLTNRSDTARQLAAEANARNLVLMIDHTYVYTSAVQRMKELVSSGQLGRIHYYDSVRINLGLFQSDVNVIWDLAPHDLSIIDYLFDERPSSVSACARRHVPGKPENIAYLTYFYDSGLIAHLHVNWLAPVKVRRTLIGGARQMVVFDELEPDEKLKVYDRGVDEGPDAQYRNLISYRAGDMWAPRLDQTEALRFATQHFVDCIRSGKTPMTDGMAGYRVVSLLEAADRSIAAGGIPVAIEGIA